MQLCFGHFVGGSHCSLWDIGLSSSFISTPLIAYLALALRADAVLHLQLKEVSLQEAVFHSQLPSGCRECACVVVHRERFWGEALRCLLMNSVHILPHPFQPFFLSYT